MEPQPDDPAITNTWASLTQETRHCHGHAIKTFQQLRDILDREADKQRQPRLTDEQYKAHWANCKPIQSDPRTAQVTHQTPGSSSTDTSNGSRDTMPKHQALTQAEEPRHCHEYGWRTAESLRATLNADADDRNQPSWSDQQFTAYWATCLPTRPIDNTFDPNPTPQPPPPPRPQQNEQRHCQEHGECTKQELHQRMQEQATQNRLPAITEEQVSEVWRRCTQPHALPFRKMTKKIRNTTTTPQGTPQLTLPTHRSTIPQLLDPIAVPYPPRRHFFNFTITIEALEFYFIPATHNQANIEEEQEKAQIRTCQYWYTLEQANLVEEFRWSAAAEAYQNFNEHQAFLKRHYASNEAMTLLSWVGEARTLPAAIRPPVPPEYTIDPPTMVEHRRCIRDQRIPNTNRYLTAGNTYTYDSIEYHPTTPEEHYYKMYMWLSCIPVNAYTQRRFCGAYGPVSFQAMKMYHGDHCIHANTGVPTLAQSVRYWVALPNMGIHYDSAHNNTSPPMRPITSQLNPNIFNLSRLPDWPRPTT